MIFKLFLNYGSIINNFLDSIKKLCTIHLAKNVKNYGSKL